MSEWGPKTIFLDLDGVLFRHAGTLQDVWQGARRRDQTLLPGVKEKLAEWDRRGYRVILTTGRRECMRADTERQLAAAGIFYDQLIVGIGRGQRVLINDLKADSDAPTAIAICLPRNEGLVNVEL